MVKLTTEEKRNSMKEQLNEIWWEASKIKEALLLQPWITTDLTPRIIKSAERIQTIVKDHEIVLE